MFSLLSSTRYDPFLAKFKWNNTPDGKPSPFLLLSYHADRLLDAAKMHGWPLTECLTVPNLKSKCEKAVHEYDGPDKPQAFKIRLALAQCGDLTTTASPVAPFAFDPTSASFFNPTTDTPSLYGPVLNVTIDTQPTDTSIFTTTKTTQRTHYDDARTRAGILPTASGPSPVTDVLLYNSKNHLTEASMYNIALYRLNQWVTPPASSGCLPGVLRRWLLEQGRIREAEEGVLTKDGVLEGDLVLLMNGVQGCQLGRVAGRAIN